jgi:hypothetical protein
MKTYNESPPHGGQGEGTSDPGRREAGPGKTQTSNKEKKESMSDNIKYPFSELVDQAMKNYEQALQAGVKLQEESSKCWTDFMNQTAAPADWQKRWNAAATETIPLIQKRMEESLRLVEQGSRTSLDLLKQALQVTGTDTPASAQRKVQELWEASLQALRNNAQAVSQANAKVVESWMQLFSKQSEAAAAASKKP